MKRFLIFISLLLIGCSSISNRYIIPTMPNHSIKTTNIQIGIKDIKVPQYLMSNKVLIRNGNTIKDINAKFITSIDKILTSNAIKELKELLNDPNVILYPWDAKSKKGYIVEIVIDDYIYNNGIIYLIGTYRIKDSKNNIIIAKNFNFHNISSIKTDNIVNTLGVLFDRLIKEIAQTIAT